LQHFEIAAGERIQAFYVSSSIVLLEICSVRYAISAAMPSRRFNRGRASAIQTCSSRSYSPLAADVTGDAADR